jgi:Mg-chelatase subunit ChlD
VEVSVTSKAAAPEIFRPFEQVLAGVNGRQAAADPAATAADVHPAESFVRIPPGATRRFTLVFREAGKASALLYRGFTRGASVPITPGTVTTPVATTPPAPAPAPPPPPQPVAADTSKPPEAVEPPGAVVEKGTFTAVQRGDIPAWLEKERAGWVDLANASLGTTCTVAGTPIEDPRQIMDLYDGVADSYHYFKPKSTFTFELLGGREAVVAAVAVFMGTRAGEASITCEGAPAEGPFTLLAAANTKERRQCLHVLDFDTVTVSRVRFRIDSPQEFYPREFYVFERPSNDPSASALSRGGLDIARRDNGGCFMYSESDYRQHLVGCIDGSVDHHAAVFTRKGRSAPIVLAFKANREALVASIGIQCRRRNEKPEPESLPAAVRVHASRTDPFRDYTLAGEFTVERLVTEQVFPLPAPVRARFLKFEFTFPPEEGTVEFSRLAVYEGTEPGYASVVLRGHAKLSRQTARTVTIEELLGGTGLTAEQEPNGEPSQATACRPGRWYGGSLGLGDTDLVTFTHGNEDEIPLLDLHMAPFLRGRVQVLDSQGNAVHEVDVAKAGGTTLQEALPLPPGTYHLSLSATDTYVLLGFDSSGSMGGTFTTTGTAMTSWATKLPPGFTVALATSLENRKTGKQFTLFCPFTKKPAAITTAVGQLFKEGGGSDWYTVIADLLEYTDTAVPPDALSAVVYLADGNGSGRFDRMWKHLRETRARVYAIGFGDVGRSLDSATSWDGARGLYNVAWYRSGRYFEPHTSEELVAVYEAIFADLRAEPRYALRFTTRRRMPGTLVTEAPRGEKRPILFILDASGSMLQELRGTTRLAIAKDVISRVVRALPPESEIGLRVYGHRYPTIDRENAETDSELLVPVGPLDRDRFLGTVAGLRARGGTPFAYSLEQAVQDISRVERPRVICVTDGIESFGGNPVAAAAALKKAAPEGAIAIVGFALGEESAQANLRQVAAAAQGVFFSAADAQSLVNSVENAINPRIPYTVLDRQGRPAARGVFGDRHRLKEGAYRLVIPAAGSDLLLDVRIAANRETVLPVPPEARPAPVPAGTPAVTDTPPPATEPPATAPKFCTQCGKRLVPGANFCTGCGARVKK